MCDTPTDWVQHFTVRPITILIMQKSLQISNNYESLFEKKRKETAIAIISYS